MSGVNYLHTKYYDGFVAKLRKRGADFKLTKTTYTQCVKIGKTTTIFASDGSESFEAFKTGKTTTFFNEDGSSDFDVLELINLVRENAKEYLSRPIGKEEKKLTDYIYFTELINKPKSKEVIFKIDIKSAYWKMALKRGIIQEIADQRLKEIFEARSLANPNINVTRAMKSARLKALGSLATRKTTAIYKGGKKVFENSHTENTRDLYMDICRSVDKLMRDCIDENEQVVFYYWDCIFIPDGFQQDVIDYFKDLEYDVSVEATTLEMVTIGETNWLLSKSDDKCYMVKKESRGLIE